MPYIERPVERIQAQYECDGCGEVREFVCFDQTPYTPPALGALKNDWRSGRDGLLFHSRQCAEAFYAKRIRRMYDDVDQPKEAMAA